MADDASNMAEKLAQLRFQYAGRIQDRIAELETLIAGLNGEDASGRNGVLELLRDAAHKLAGSGATFGFPGVTTVSRNIEHLCVAVLEGRDSSENLMERLRNMCAHLYDAAEVQEAAEPRPTSDAPRPAAPHLHGSSRQTILFIMEYDEAVKTRVLREMDHFGFETRFIDHPAKLHDHVKNYGPVSAIVTGLDFDGEDEAALKPLQAFRDDDANGETSIVVQTHVDTMQARLGAVRVGAKAFLVKPVDMADLVDVLDQVIHGVDDDPFRVLVIDDDESLARHTEVVLQSAGMETQVITDAMDLFEAVESFSPELILLDLYMPGCDGQEIAAILRQKEEYAGIPIVFLSGESDKDKQLLAMELGGDDFLTKPIRASHLISSVRIRASRFRELRSFMVRDSMTGLFNHTTTKQLLETEIARTTRSGGKLSLAALDIDHFKSVNDTYGHAVGDRVIKALARLLRQRLRSADVIGRMGGEEFAAILPDSGVDEAEQVFNAIRQAFEDIVFRSDRTSFNVTLSCGVAAFPMYDTATTLSDAADKALYAAKHAGRNRVVKVD